MRKEDQNFIRISGTVKNPPKISVGEKRNEATFELCNKDFTRVGVKNNTFNVRWYGELQSLKSLNEGDRIMVVGKVATFRDNNNAHQVFLTTKEIIYY